MSGRYPPGGGQCCEEDTINMKGDGEYLKTRQGMISAGNLQTIFLSDIIPIFLEPFRQFRIQIYYRDSFDYMFFRWHWCSIWPNSCEF